MYNMLKVYIIYRRFRGKKPQVHFCSFEKIDFKDLK